MFLIVKMFALSNSHLYSYQEEHGRAKAKRVCRFDFLWKSYLVTFPNAALTD